jgi:Phosphodiester glycosidase
MGWMRRASLVAGVLLAAIVGTWPQEHVAARRAPGAAELFPGITYVDRTDDTPRAVHMHVVQVDLTTPGIRFELSPHAGSLEVVRETTAAFLRREQAQVAINAHFFWPWPSTADESEVLGIAASAGDVYSAFETPEQSYAILPDAPGLNIDRENHASLVHRDPAQPDGRHVREPVTLWNTLAGSAQIVTNGTVTIPVYRDEAHPDGALMPGGPGAGFSNTHSWYEATNARTAIGLSRDARTLTLFTVDVRGGSLGMTVGEAARRLVDDFGVWEALNLDGGGSTSMAIEDPVTHEASIVNASSDNPSGRSVGSNLAVFAPHGPPAPVESGRGAAARPVTFGPRTESIQGYRGFRS